MGQSLFSLVSKKIVSTVIAVGSLFYSTISGVVAEFDEIRLDTNGDRLAVSTRLLNCYSEDLDRIFTSGKEIRVHFLVQLLEGTTEVPTSETSFYHSLQYSLVDRVYRVIRSHGEERREGLSLDRAKEIVAQLDEVIVTTAGELSAGTVYKIRVTAYLDRIELPGKDEELNLMFYWNSLKPTTISEPFTKEIFRQ